MMTLLLIAAFLCGFSVLPSSAHSEQSNQLDDHKLYQLDTVKTFVALPRGRSYTYGNENIRYAFQELIAPARSPECELVKLIVAGCASPDGLWAYNVTLSEDRTKNTVQYLRALGLIPARLIQGECRYEDWDMLREMVLNSDFGKKGEIVEIIDTMTWGERKTALKNLDDSKVWERMELEFFPFMRGVELIAVYNRPSVDKSVSVNAVSNSKPDECYTRMEVPSNADTVYIRDTVYLYGDDYEVGKNEGVNVKKNSYEPVSEDNLEPSWKFGVKTNLLSDVIVIPSIGVEFQLGRYFSLDIQGSWTGYNLFVPMDSNASFYGVSPELRWWLKGDSMRSGSFLGVHGNCAWYSMQWRDGLLYQNGDNNRVDDAYVIANMNPAWSVGITYGYSLGLGKKANWGLEFLVGAGYLKACQNVSESFDGVWVAKEYQEMTGWGLTKAAVNLTYRFSFKR